jgi:hypothetical protein
MRGISVPSIGLDVAWVSLAAAPAPVARATLPLDKSLPLDHNALQTLPLD